VNPATQVHVNTSTASWQVAPFWHAPAPSLAAQSSMSAQVAAVSMPVAHDDVPETVYPAAHVGAQVAPDASVLVQVPAKPLVGAPDASHGLAAQVAALKQELFLFWWAETLKCSNERSRC
jgi:hypothetical protein